MANYYSKGWRWCRGRGGDWWVSSSWWWACSIFSGPAACWKSQSIKQQVPCVMPQLPKPQLRPPQPWGPDPPSNGNPTVKDNLKVMPLHLERNHSLWHMKNFCASCSPIWGGCPLGSQVEIIKHPIQHHLALELVSLTCLIRRTSSMQVQKRQKGSHE